MANAVEDEGCIFKRITKPLNESQANKSSINELEKTISDLINKSIENKVHL